MMCFLCLFTLLLKALIDQAKSAELTHVVGMYGPKRAAAQAATRQVLYARLLSTWGGGGSKGGLVETSASDVFGALLRRYRGDAGLTQEEMAERAGVGVRDISDLERGMNQAPYLATVARLTEALGLSEQEGGAALEAAIVHLLRWEGLRLVSLTGPRGVGKSRLALQAASTVVGDFAEGAVWRSTDPVRELPAS